MAPRHLLVSGARLAIAASLVFLYVAEVHAQRPQRYGGMLANGQRIAGEKLADWHNAEAKPRLDSQQLLDAGNPVKWLRDRALPLATLPEEFVETHTGDILPGRVVDFRTGQESPFDPLPSHLVVEPALAFAPPGKTTDPTIRVVTAALKRVVWQRMSRQTYQPGTVFFRDGRALVYRAFRFGSGSVTVLLDEGSQRISWSDIAEIHLPRADFWSAYFDELAGLCATSAARLIQLETASGLIATSSLDRFAHRFEGNPQDSERWVHAVQPAWCLDILWIPCREISMRRSFAASQVPLSRVPPARIVAQSLLAGSGRPPQVNRNVFSGQLQSADHEFGWGIGVQARSELSFDLPDAVKSLRGSVGIDRSSGAGGCVKCRIFANDVSAPPLWESAVLVGSTTVADFGTIPLGGPTAGQQRLVLQVDPAHDGRPAGADPLDIRDAVNWLDLVLELDPAAIQRQLDQRLADRQFAWQGATVRAEPPAGESLLNVSYLRNEDLPLPGYFRTFVGDAKRSLVVEKSFTLKPTDRWLILSAFRLPNGPEPPKLEIFIADEPAAEYEPPPLRSDLNDARPLAISLAPYPAGATIRVSVRQRAAANAPPLYWRTFQPAGQLPTLHQAFEDETQIASLAGAVVDDIRHHGTHSIRVAAGQTVELPLSGPVAIRERPRWGEYRFLRFAVRKQGKGRMAVTLNGEQRRPEPPRYDGGQGAPVEGKSLRIWPQPLTEQWVVLTRDLYADFGPADWTSLTLSCPDGQAAWFDHIYLGRSPEDFKLIAAAPSAEATNQKAREELARQAIDHVRPAIVTLTHADGQTAGGCCIAKSGEILTAGHFLRGPNLDLTVRFADGKTAKARSLGISREYDLGLAKISDQGKWPFVEPTGKDMDPHAPYAALLFTGKIASDSPPQLAVASLRRFFRTMLWTDADAESFAPGGVLVTPRGQLAGLHVRRSQFGGFLFTRLHGDEMKSHMERVRKGEVVGAWLAGSEPVLGLEGKPTIAGYEVTSTTEGGPAAKGGVMRGDVVSRLHGKPVTSLEDISAALAESDPGHSVLLELVRGGAPVKVSVVLAPRVP